jgi:hypothetical protein
MRDLFACGNVTESEDAGFGTKPVLCGSLILLLTYGPIVFYV